MPQQDYDAKLNAVFEKIDKLAYHVAEHDKWAAGLSSKLQSEINYLMEELKQLREEQRIQQNQLHVAAETANEERYKLKDLLQKEIDEAEKNAVKASNGYTNRGVSIATGVIVFIIGIVEAVWYVKDIIHGGGH